MTTTRIYVHNVQTHCSIGIYQTEQQGPQPLTIDVDVTLRPGATARHIDETLNYLTIKRYLQSDIPAMGHIMLLEELGERIADWALGFTAVSQVHVDLRKDLLCIDGEEMGVIVEKTKNDPALSGLNGA